MCTAKGEVIRRPGSGQAARRLAWLAFWLALSARGAAAHPVSQGNIAVDIRPDRLELRAEVSREEVLVAGALSGRRELLDPGRVRDHGDYLLDHIQLSADGRRLDGRVLETARWDRSPLVYRLEYPFRGGPPQRIELRQNILREFEFAPGNRWEASYLVQVSMKGKTLTRGLLFTYREPLTVAASDTTGFDQTRLAGAFVRHGIVHILRGYDHLLFVGALVLGAATWWELVKVITAFTLAHTLTLALSALDLVRLPAELVEPMIAASIVFVAVHNLVRTGRNRGWTPLGVAFGFGLFHGLGFAGGLLEVMAGMPSASTILAIGGFSLGVELGHQVVVLPAFLGMVRLRRSGECAVFRMRQFGSIAISLAGLMYLYAALL